LRLRKVEKEAVIKFAVNKTGCDGASNGKVESVSYASEIADSLEARFKNCV